MGPDWLDWQTVKNAIGAKELVSTAIGALAGAWGGAYAAQRIADSRQRRERLGREVKKCTELLELLHGIANSHINAKEQQVEGLRTQYRIQKGLMHWHQRRLDDGEVPPGTPIDIGQIDLRTLTLPAARVDAIERILMEELSISGRPRTLIGVLRGSVETLGVLSTRRNQWLLQFQAAALSNYQKAVLLFGLPDNESHVDDTYGNLIEGIHRSVDECIMFAVMLGEDVRKHGLAMRRAYRTEYGRDIARVGRLCFDDVADRGMMPDRSDFQSWDRAAVTGIPATRGRRFKSLHYWKRLRWRRLWRKGLSAQMSN